MAPTTRAVLTAVAAAGIAAFQLLVPPSIGLADNGDFPRVAGRLSLCPQAGWDRDRFDYFVAKYRESRACYWDSGVPSSIMGLAWIAKTGDLRALAAVEAVMLGLIAAFLPPVALLFFTDVSYVAFFNSFYMDGGALLFFLATAAAAAWMLKGRRIAGLAFALAALLLVTSKTQHAWLALPLAVFLVLFARPRAAGIAGAFALIAAAVYMTAATPVEYKSSNLWNSVFATLLPDAGNRDQALQSLGLGPEYAPLIGRNAYQFPDQPTAVSWIGRFYSRVGYIALGRYYAAHPGEAITRMWRSAARMYLVRPWYLGNYERAEGRAPREQTQAFGWWSAAKSWVYHRAPWAAVLVYLASGVLLWRSRYRPLIWLLGSMAAIEFLLATFADSVEDARHFFLIHAIADAWLIFALAAVRESGLLPHYLRGEGAAHTAARRSGDWDPARARGSV